jgi:uncharacterized pyridoxamine 5'-phosphate oxidase family protein
MDFKYCLRFAYDNPFSFIATFDGETPGVRAFLMWFAYKSGIYYQAAAAKSVYKQLENNHHVEICTDPLDKILRSNSHNLCH